MFLKTCWVFVDEDRFLKLPREPSVLTQVYWSFVSKTSLLGLVNMKVEKMVLAAGETGGRTGKDGVTAHLRQKENCLTKPTLQTKNEFFYNLF